jgi:hypothetical protein
MVAHACNPVYSGGKGKDYKLRPAWAKLVRPYLKKTKNPQKAGDMAQVVEYLPSKHETLGSVTSTRKKRKKKPGGGVLFYF